MNANRLLIVAGLITSQLLVAAPSFAQGADAPVTQLETIVVTAKKADVTPVTQLETVVVVSHRSEVLAAARVATTKVSALNHAVPVATRM